MILNDEPWRNEPGAPASGGSHFWIKDRITAYNRHQEAQTVRFAMLDWLQRKDMRNGFWSDVLANYFQLNRGKILASVRRKAKSNPSIERYRGGDGGPYDMGPMFGNASNLLIQLETALGIEVQGSKQSGRG